MYTTARLADAAKESSNLMATSGKAAAEILLSARRDQLPLDAALAHSEVQAKYAAVASHFQIKEPDFLAAHKFLLQSQRSYLEVHKRKRKT
jgi:hypothetical protein